MSLTGSAIAPRNVETEVDSPLADPDLVGVLRTSPSQDVLPPLFLGELAGGAGLQRSDGIGWLSARAQVVRRRERQSCLDPAAA